MAKDLLTLEREAQAEAALKEKGGEESKGGAQVEVQMEAMMKV